MLLRVAPDLDGPEALQLGEVKAFESGGNRAPLDGIGKDEGEVAFDGLKARELAGGGTAQRQGVERGEIERDEVCGLAELARLAVCGGELAEDGDGVAVEEGRGAAAGSL